MWVRQRGRGQNTKAALHNHHTLQKGGIGHDRGGKACCKAQQRGAGGQGQAPPQVAAVVQHAPLPTWPNKITQAW